MNPVNLAMCGRMGNMMFQYCYARALAEREGRELRTQRWYGERVFKIDPTAPPDLSDKSRVTSGYFQNQDSLIYTRKQVREWFQWQDWVLDKLKNLTCIMPIAHKRRGDYAGYGYVVVSDASYDRALEKFGIPLVHCVSAENAIQGGFPDELAWVPDFYLMTQADILLRANSSFSWWAATLGHGRVFCPNIDGLKGGQEQDCEFVEGNHKKFVELPNITDLHLREE